MHRSIPGYRLTQELHRSNRALVYRGVREADALTVIIKLLNKDHPDSREMALLEREHGLLGALEQSEAIGTHGLVTWGDTLALVMEDCGALPLSGQLAAGERMELADFFELAIACARALEPIHRRVVHKDLHPGNILWNPLNGTLRIVGFSLASELGPEARGPEAPRHVVGSLPFMSPEQSGRMNRDLDARSDLYALGITFYWLLTGELPFRASDPLEWVYCHVTRVPVPPQRLNPAVPGVLGDVLLRLMAKNPADRYQSAQGLLEDLLECRRQWQESGRVAPFPLALRDVRSQLHLNQRLYGRTEEAKALRASCEEAARGKTLLVTVSGPAGSGKSALVHDVIPSAMPGNGHFLTGKFEQYQRHAPYAGVSQALTRLVRHLLTEPEENLTRWKAEFEHALGQNGHLALELVPDLVHVIGPQPPMGALNPTEEQNRFLATFDRLVSAIARPEHPAVLFLDDLQWSDAPTLRLVRSLLETRDDKALLVIVAYRDDELPEGWSLPSELGAAWHAPETRHLQLHALDEPTINRIVADALQMEPATTRSLGSLIRRKTEGIPFFAKELLRTLHQDGLVAFDHSAERWTWDLEAIQRSRISEDVVGFMLGRIRRLEPDTQALLSMAACLGSTFELHLLPLALGQSPAAVMGALWPAILAGLVVPLHGENLPFCLEDEGGRLPREFRCEFLHDRVHQAAYALVPAPERQAAHLLLGRLMLAQAGEEERGARAQEIAQQLNAGRALISDETERMELVHLNLLAARKAKEAAAYRPAFEFVQVARELLGPGAWSDHHALAFDVFKLNAMCAHLCGEFDAAGHCCRELLAHSLGPLERAEVHAMKSALHTHGNRMDEAIAEGIRALALLGVKLSPTPGKAAVLVELALTRAAQGRRKACDLAEAPIVTDRALQLKLKILADFMAPAYLTGNQTLFATAMLRLARLTMRHGNCVEAVTAYSCYAVMLAGLGDFKGAHAFGQLALRLAETFGALQTKSRTLVLYGLFSHSWSQPWSSLAPWFKDSVAAGRQSGDFLFVAFACGYVHLWDPRIDLGTALAEGEKYLALCRQTHYRNALNAASCAHQLWRGLRGETASPLSLSDANFDEAACLQEMERDRYLSGVGIYHLYKLQLACIHGAWDAAWQELLLAESAMGALAGSPYVVEFAVHGFQAAARMAESRGRHAPAAWRRLRRFHRWMQTWTRHCPDNFRPHLLLMEAELAHLGGKRAETPRRFEHAVLAAQESGFLRYEALANEATARFYLSMGVDTVARTYLQEARKAYERWGALAKVRALDALAPQPSDETSGARQVSSGAVADLHGVHLGLVPQLVENGVLDLATVWKATQAISGEVILKRLLEKLLIIVKESAGAQKGILVLTGDEGGSPSIVMEAVSPADGDFRLQSTADGDGLAELPLSLLRYVLRSQTSVVLHDAARHGAFTQDPYIRSQLPRSVLALPIVNQGNLLGALYLENNLLTDAFTPEHQAVLQILSAQAAISLQNALAAERAAYLEAEQTISEAYARALEVRVSERTAELREANDRLVEVDRLKTNFLSLVSHELRTPLTTILGYAEFLEDRVAGELSPGQDEFLHQIQQATHRLQRLVDDLLDFARIEAGTFKLVASSFDLSAKVTEVVESFRPLFRTHDLGVAVELPGEPVWFAGDPGRVAQVVLNLLGNAIKFTPPGGRIGVQLVTSGTELRLSVTDSGIGIDPAHQEKLFQKFYQVDSSSTRKQGGAGLGLSIARSIVEAHGGQIGVRSVPDEGSTFWFTLPLRAVPTETEPGETAFPRAIDPTVR